MSNRLATLLSALFLAYTLVQCEGEQKIQTAESMRRQAIMETNLPIHPGIPRERPFWNRHSRRFITAPAFEFAALPGAEKYLFRASSPGDSVFVSFSAPQPWAALTPIWHDLPCDSIHLTIQAQFSGSDSLQMVGERTFIKSPPFSASVGDPAYDYAESGWRCLRDLLQQEKAQSWLQTGRPNADYQLWVHPSKIMGALVRGMAAYAAHEPRFAEADQALVIARNAADFLLSLSEPAGSPLEFWPPTYWDGVARGNHPIYMNEIMTHYPAEGAMDYLDLYDLTQEKKYFTAATRIADTYLRLQRTDGNWFQLLDRRTGEPVKNNLLLPAPVIGFFDRLQKQYGLQTYRQARDRAFHWCVENPLQTFNWSAQFEDTRPKSLYKNLSHREALQMVLLLFENASDGKTYAPAALEILRFAEDQFVVWQESDPVVTAKWFKPGSVWNGYSPETGSDWFLPAAVEQYAFFTPINSTVSWFIHAFISAYRYNGEPIYLAKAVALANTLTRAQKYHGGGEIPTHLRKNLPEANWLNCSVHSALTLIEHADLLSTCPLDENR